MKSDMVLFEFFDPIQNRPNRVGNASQKEPNDSFLEAIHPSDEVVHS